MQPDKFWKKLWLGSSALLLLSIAGSATVFFVHIGRIDAAAVGMSFDPTKDPFETSLIGGAFAATHAPAITHGYIYEDAVPAGVTSWAWDAKATWHSTAQKLEGSSALKLDIAEAWGGAGLGSLQIDLKANKTLTLSVYPDQNIKDLYIELYNKAGVSMGRQSLSWYANEGALKSNQWNTVSIPLVNLLDSSADIVSAFSLSSTNAGTVYIDAVQFTNTPSAHAKWVFKPAEDPVYIAPPFNPFATSTRANLPYVFENSATNDPRWYGIRGYFEQTYDVFKVGPQKGGHNDALAVFRSGKFWNDYVVKAQVAWGGPSVFSLIVRMTDENNYVSCAFSAGGDTVQMYSVVDGVSTEVTQSDKLHYSDYTGGLMGAGAMVHGNTLTCSLDGKQILSQSIDTMQPQGTVGRGAWDSNDKVGPSQVISLEVDALAGE